MSKHVGKGTRASERAAVEARTADAPPGKRSLVARAQADVQMKGAGGQRDVHEAASRGTQGSGDELPFLSQLQASFGSHDLTGVRAYSGAAANSATKDMGAEAYATGNKVAFGSDPSLHTVAHEAAHVIQQRGGVQLKDDVGTSGDAYEEHADAVADLVVQGKSAEGLLSRTPSGGQGTAVQKLEDDDASVDSDGGTLTAASGEDDAHEPTPGPAVQKRSSAPVQLAGGKKKKKQVVPYEITVTSPMSQAEFRVVAMKQVFGGVIDNVVWSGGQERYTPEGSPYTLNVSVTLLKLHRGAVNARRGFDVEADGGIKGGAERAKDFHGSEESADKNAIMNEIDRRYYAAAGVPEGTKIEEGEKGRSALWNSVRDEVLFQHEYIANLPPEVKKMIKESVNGKVLTPRDYDQLFRIAKKIERMKAGQVGDYVSKITGSTTDLDEFERSLANYSMEMAQRDEDAGEREQVKTKLVGLEETYKLYRALLAHLALESASPGSGLIQRLAGLALGDDSPLPVDVLARKLDASVKANGFASIADFVKFIVKFEKGFKQASALIVDDLLIRYEARLYKEQQRYQNRSEVEALHAQLGGMRKEQKAFRKHHDSARKLDKKRDRHLYRGEPWVSGKTSEQIQHEEKAATHKQAAKLEVEKLAKVNPVFSEEHLPSDKQINKDAVSSATVDELQALLLSHIASKIADAREARARIAEKPSLIYKMDKMLPQFFMQQSIASGSIFDSIIRDKLSDDSMKDLIVGIVVAIVAIALTVVSMGTATPALVAAGAAAGAFGISAFMAYDEFQKYVEQKDLADVGLAKDPSAVWLVVAIVGAAIDMGAAAKALKALGPAADAFKLTGNADEFSKALKLLEEAGELDAKMAAAAEKAAKAKSAYAAAKGDLAKTLGGKLYSFPGPLADPDVYIALVKMAKAKIQETGINIINFIDEVKSVRLASKYGALSPEELAKAKEAYKEAQDALKAADAASVNGPHTVASTSPPRTSSGPTWSRAPRAVLPSTNTGQGSRLLSAWSGRRESLLRTANHGRLWNSRMKSAQAVASRASGCELKNQLEQSTVIR